MKAFFRRGWRPPLREGGRSRRDGERGSLTLETAVIFPAVMMLIFGVIQGALYYHASDVARHAAYAAANAASAHTGSEGTGQAAAASFISQLGGERVLAGSTIAVARSMEMATATVTGRSVSLVPGLELPLISQSAQAPVERWVPSVP
nr:pilus assembly protein [Actinomycetales bacterium]